MKKEIDGSWRSGVRIWVATLVLAGNTAVFAELQPEPLWPNGAPDAWLKKRGCLK